jgi:hypothetical protein
MSQPAAGLRLGRALAVRDFHTEPSNAKSFISKAGVSGISRPSETSSHHKVALPRRDVVGRIWAAASYVEGSRVNTWWVRALMSARQRKAPAWSGWSASADCAAARAAVRSRLLTNSDAR